MRRQGGAPGPSCPRPQTASATSSFLRVDRTFWLVECQYVVLHLGALAQK
jgi:hypothetical protein